MCTLHTWIFTCAFQYALIFPPSMLKDAYSDDQPYPHQLFSKLTEILAAKVELYVEGVCVKCHAKNHED